MAPPCSKTIFLTKVISERTLNRRGVQLHYLNLREPRECFCTFLPDRWVILNQGRNQLFISRGQFSWNFTRWRHRAYSTMVQIFRKRHR